jgi:hypothetical protein
VRTDSTGVAHVRWVLGRTPGAHAMAVRVEGIRSPLALAARAEPSAPANLAFEHAPEEGRAGRALPSAITAVVTDVYGNPVGDAAVSFAAHGGTVSPARAVSDARGRVQVRWTLGAKEGEQVLTGSVRGTDVRSTLAVQAVVPPAPAKAATPAVASAGTHGAPSRVSSPSHRSGAKQSTTPHTKTTAKAPSKTQGKGSAGSRARDGRGM